MMYARKLERCTKSENNPCENNYRTKSTQMVKHGKLGKHYYRLVSQTLTWNKKKTKQKKWKIERYTKKDNQRSCKQQGTNKKKVVRYRSVSKQNTL